MRLALSRSFLVLLTAVLLFPSFSYAYDPVGALLNGGCPSGTEPATAADIPAMLIAGIQSPEIGMCWDRTDTRVGQGIAQAKEELDSMWCGGRAASCTYRGVTYTSSIEGLDPKFAICAKKFMDVLHTVDPSACIRSAWRSTAHQVCACGGNANGIPGKCAPAGRSYHQRGLAIDVNHSVNVQTLWKAAATAGLGNPTSLHSSDPDHIQPLGGTLDCSTSGFIPVDTDFYTAAPQTPLSPVSDYLRKLLGMPPPSSLGTPASTGTPGSTGKTTTIGTPTGGGSGGSSSGGSNEGGGSPTACNPQYYCEKGTYYYHSSSCQDIAIQKCPNGCAGDTCALPTTSTSPNSPASQGGGSGSATSSTSTPQSAIDIIQQYANPGSTVEIGTATPIALNQNIGDLASVMPNIGSNTSELLPTQAPSLQAGAQQTFVSPDLSNSRGTVSGQNTFALGMLESMKQSLIWALNYLQPFGGISSPVYGE